MPVGRLLNWPTALTATRMAVNDTAIGDDQGDISGLSRSVSYLGSSFGTALVGSVLVAVKLPAGKPFAVGMAMMLGFVLPACSSRFCCPTAGPGWQRGTRGQRALGGCRPQQDQHSAVTAHIEPCVNPVLWFLCLRAQAAIALSVMARAFAVSWMAGPLAGARRPVAAPKRTTHPASPPARCCWRRHGKVCLTVLIRLSQAVWSGQPCSKHPKLSR
jgi:hypothetical protein